MGERIQTDWQFVEDWVTINDLATVAMGTCDINTFSAARKELAMLHDTILQSTNASPELKEIAADSIKNLLREDDSTYGPMKFAQKCTCVRTSGEKIRGPSKEARDMHKHKKAAEIMMLLDNLKKINREITIDRRAIERRVAQIEDMKRRRRGP